MLYTNNEQETKELAIILMKKLYRSNQEKILGGVLGGFAEHIEKDPTLVRLAYVLITLIFNLPGILFYIICWAIIPKKQEQVSRETNNHHEDFNVPHETSDIKSDAKDVSSDQ